MDGIRRQPPRVERDRPIVVGEASDSRYRELFDHAEDAIVVADASGACVDANPAATRLLGYEATELVRMHLSDMVATVVDEQVATVVDEQNDVKQLLGQAPWRGTVRLRHETGSLVTAEVRIALFDDGGEQLFAVIARETPRPLESDQRPPPMAAEYLQIITRSVGDAITIRDADGRLVYANDEAAILSGYSSAEAFLVAPPDEALQRFELLDEDGSVFPENRLPGRLALRGEESAEAVIRVRDKASRRERWTRVRASPVRDRSATIRYVVNVSHDITAFKETEGLLRFQKALLEAQAEASSEGIVVVSPEGDVLWSNRRFGEIWGFPERLASTGASGLTLASLLEDATDPKAFAELSARLFDQEGDGDEQEIALGDRRLLECRTAPLGRREGANFGRIGFVRDVTVHRKRTAAERFLSEASRELVGSLDYERTLSKIVRLAVPQLADWCAVDLLAPDGSIRPMAVGHVDESKLELAEAFRRRHPPQPDDPVGVPRVIRTGEPELYPEISEELIEAAVSDPGLRNEIRDLVRDLELRSVMIVPLAARGRTFGSLTFGWGESGRTYDDEDVRLALDLAGRVALTVDNARLYRERDGVARTLQRSLLPRSLPEIPRFELAAAYRAAGEANDVGGDFYDVFETPDGGWALAIGDVCGKGPAAAALMGAARHTLRTAALKDARPSDILRTLNTVVRSETEEGRFCTVCLVRLRPSDVGARLTVCPGGHPLPVLLSSDGGAEFVGNPGTILGIFEDVDLSDVAVDLRPGDTVVLYTDGVTDEQRDGEEFGEERLMDLLESCAGMSAHGIVARLQRAIVEFQPSTPQDDMAILVVRATG